MKSNVRIAQYLFPKGPATNRNHIRDLKSWDLEIFKDLLDL